jgi:hypothetical protein
MSEGTFKSYATDPKLEKEGVPVETRAGTVILARAGGANRAFSKAIEKKTRRWRRAKAIGQMPVEAQERCQREAFAETLIKGWWKDVTWPVHPDGATRKDAKGEPADCAGQFFTLEEAEELKKNPIEVEEQPIPFTVANAVMMLEVLPDWYVELVEYVDEPELFKHHDREESAKNS